MKRTLIAIICAAAAGLAYAAPAKKAAPSTPATSAVAAPDPVSEFKSIVAAGSEPKSWTRVFLHPRNGKWAKQYYTLGQVKFDVKKTDSLLSPAMGMVSFPVEVKLSEFFETEQEASETASVSDLKVTYFYSGKYLFSDNAWQTDQFSYYAAVGDARPDPTTVTLPRDRLIRDRDSGKEESQWLYKWLR